MCTKHKKTEVSLATGSQLNLLDHGQQSLGEGIDSYRLCIALQRM